MSLIATAKNSNTVPAGRHLAELVDIEAGNSQYGPTYKWILTVQAGKTRQRLTAVTSQKAGQAAKWRQGAEALLGRPLKDQETVDLLRFVGTVCDINVTRETVSGKNGGTMVVNRIQGLRPAHQQKRLESAPVPRGAELTDDDASPEGDDVPF
jgi:hypothetical protein